MEKIKNTFVNWIIKRPKSALMIFFVLSMSVNLVSPYL